MSNNVWNEIGVFAAVLTVCMMVFKITGEEIRWMTCLAPVIVYMICTCIMVCVMTFTGYLVTKWRERDDNRAGI